MFWLVCAFGFVVLGVLGCWLSVCLTVVLGFSWCLPSGVCDCRLRVRL